MVIVTRNDLDGDSERIPRGVPQAGSNLNSRLPCILSFWEQWMTPNMEGNPDLVHVRL